MTEEEEEAGPAPSDEEEAGINEEEPINQLDVDVDVRIHLFDETETEITKVKELLSHEDEVSANCLKEIFLKDTLFVTNPQMMKFISKQGKQDAFKKVIVSIREFKKTLKAPKKKKDAKEEELPPAIVNIPPEVFEQDIKDIASKLVATGKLCEHYLTTTETFHYGDDDLKKYLLLAHLAIFVPGERQRNTALSGESQSGKSSCANRSMDAFPNNQKVMLSGISEKALSYTCKDNPAALQYKSIYVDESNSSLHGALKSMTNNDTADCTFITVDNGRAVGINVLKPFVVFVSSVQVFKEPEMRNRFGFPSSEDDIHKKHEVDDKIGEAAMDNKLWSVQKYNLDKNYAVCRCAIEMTTEELRKLNGAIVPEELKPLVRNFYQYFNRGDRLDFVSLCRVLTYLDPFNHARTASNELIAKPGDIEEAIRMWQKSTAKMGNMERWIVGILSRDNEMVTELDGSTTEVEYHELSKRKLLEAIKQFHSEAVNKKTLERSLEKLVDLGLVDHTEIGQGKTTKYYLTENRPEKDDEPEEVPERKLNIAM
jgi:uncharacterized protein YbcI/predicted RNA-binding protein YlqC (UPF0109 family)